MGITSLTTEQFAQRLLEVYPKPWTSSAAKTSGNLFALLTTLSSQLAVVSNQLLTVYQGIYIQLATGNQLDAIALDYFGTSVVRTPNQTDASFRTTILSNLIFKRATREAVSKVVQLTTSETPRLTEPFRPADTGSWGPSNGAGPFYWDVDTPSAPFRWGGRLPYNGFIETLNIGGAVLDGNPLPTFDTNIYFSVAGPSGSAIMNAESSWFSSINNLLQNINKTRAFGTEVWVRYVSGLPQIYSSVIDFTISPNVNSTVTVSTDSGKTFHLAVREGLTSYSRAAFNTDVYPQVYLQETTLIQGSIVQSGVSGTGNNNSATVSLSKMPVVGDVLIAVVLSSNAVSSAIPAINIPSGWTVLAQQSGPATALQGETGIYGNGGYPINNYPSSNYEPNLYQTYQTTVMALVVTSSNQATSYTFTDPSTFDYMDAVVCEYSGLQTSSILDVASGTGTVDENVSTQTPVLNGVTTTANYDCLIGVVINTTAGNDSISKLPSGFSLIANSSDTLNHQEIFFLNANQAATGATGNFSMTMSSSSDYVTMLIGVKSVGVTSSNRLQTVNVDYTITPPVLISR